MPPCGGDTLHWFGLTDGWYWIEVRGHELLRQTQTYDPRSYVDYYVERLCDDIAALTPDVLELVHDDLQALLESDPGRWAHDPPELRFRRTGPEVVTIDWAHEDDGTIVCGVSTRCASAWPPSACGDHRGPTGRRSGPGPGSCYPVGEPASPVRNEIRACRYGPTVRRSAYSSGPCWPSPPGPKMTASMPRAE